MKRLIVGLTAAAVVIGAGQAHADILFLDDFESESTPPTPPGYIANYDGFAKWDVTGSGVDLVGPLVQATFVDSIVVDLDGTSGSTLITKEAFQLLPDVFYTLTFDLGGPLGGTSTDTVVVELGDVFTESISITRQPRFETFTWSVTVASPTTGKLSFTDLGADSNGALLDNVRLEANAVPEPSTLTIFGGLLGMGLIGCVWRRRRTSPLSNDHRHHANGSPTAD